MPEDLELIGRRETVELQHDRRVERSHVAVPDVVGNTSEKNIGVTAFKRLGDGKLRNRLPLPKIFAKKQRVNAGGIPPNNYILIIVRKNLRLNEVARA